MPSEVVVTAPAVTKVVKQARVQDGQALKVKLLTAGDYAPFTHKDSPNGGLITEIVDAAMTSASGKGGYDIHRVNDWAAHLDPLLSQSMLDMGFRGSSQIVSKTRIDTAVKTSTFQSLWWNC